MKSQAILLVAVIMLVTMGRLTLWSMGQSGDAELVVGEQKGADCDAARLSASNDGQARVGWREGLGEWRRKGRPYRNPLRRYRVGKKARAKVHRCLARLGEIEEELASLGGKECCGMYMEDGLVAVGDVASERWG